MKRIRSLKYLPDDAMWSEMKSPVGKLIIFGSKEGLHAILWESYLEIAECKDIVSSLPKKQNLVIRQTKSQLQEYFAGTRRRFDLPLVLKGTEFQMKAWNELLRIPYAKTISYGEQAQNMGDKKKARAVGMSNGLNPISIVVPCHRVIGSSGDLTGFGGGLKNKKYLLDLEKLSIE